MTVLELLDYPFIIRALAAGVLIALLCGALGVFLVLRRLSLIGDGLSHVSFGAVAAVLCAGVPSNGLSLAAIPVVILAGLAIQRIIGTTRIHGDAAIGIVSAGGIAAGVLLVSLAGGSPAEVMGFLFGSILSIGNGELIAAALLCGASLVGIFLFYHELFASTFDEELAQTSGVRVRRVTTMLTVVTAVTVVLAMRLVGIMLVSALLVIPASTALTIAGGFRSTMILSMLVAVVSVVSGVLVSLVADFPAGATIIVVSLFLFVMSLVYDSFRTGAERGGSS